MSFLYHGAATYSEAVKQLGYHLELLWLTEQNAALGSDNHKVATFSVLHSNFWQ